MPSPFNSPSLEITVRRLIELLIARGVIAYDDETKAMLESLYATEYNKPLPEHYRDRLA